MQVRQHLAAAEHDAGERILDDVDRQVRFFLEQHVEPPEQRPAARHDDPPIDDISGELGRGLLECLLDGRRYLAQRLGERLAHFGARDSERFRKTGDEIDP